jgi:hypothetical protein
LLRKEYINLVKENVVHSNMGTLLLFYEKLTLKNDWMVFVKYLAIIDFVYIEIKVLIELLLR